MKLDSKNNNDNLKKVSINKEVNAIIKTNRQIDKVNNLMNNKTLTKTLKKK